MNDEEVVLTLRRVHFLFFLFRLIDLFRTIAASDILFNFSLFNLVTLVFSKTPIFFFDIFPLYRTISTKV